LFFFSPVGLFVIQAIVSAQGRTSVVIETP
jgi:hypothetical protein